MRSFTDVFIKHPVLAIVVNLVIVLMGWRALTSLPVQQFPKIESSSVVDAPSGGGAGIGCESLFFFPQPAAVRTRTSTSKMLRIWVDLRRMSAPS